MAELLVLARMARRLGVTAKWLREAADRGEVPCLKTDKRYLFNAEATTEAVAKLAAAGKAVPNDR